jgi:hypothetical protein
MSTKYLAGWGTWQSERIPKSGELCHGGRIDAYACSFESVDSIPQGHVCLVLFSKDDSLFYLQIHLNIIDSLCLKPVNISSSLVGVFLGFRASWLSKMAVMGFQQTDLWKIKGYTIMLQTSGASFLFKLLLSCLQDTDDLLSV